MGDSVDFVQFMRKPRDCNRLNVISDRSNTAAIKRLLLFVDSFFIGFLVEIRRLSKSEILFWMALFLFFTLLDA